jgi:hypothetical protein
MTTSAVKYPEALEVNAAVLLPAATVPLVFLGKPVPVTVTSEPAGPLEALSVMAVEAACAGGATPAASVTRTATKTASLSTGPAKRVKAPYAGEAGAEKGRGDGVDAGDTAAPGAGGCME